MKCKNCGQELASDSNFCDKCGAKVEIDEAQPIDVSDLGPDNIDDLMPKKHHTFLICFLVLLVAIIAGTFMYLSLQDEPIIKKKSKENDNQTIIDDYAKEIEAVASSYLLDHELINDFAEIKELVEYDAHDVSCDNTYINIDGTVYLSECQIDGKHVDEVYGRRKNIATKADACDVVHDSDEDTLQFYVDKELISVYECDHDKCDLYDVTNYNSCYDMIAIIEDGDNKYLYNYQAIQNLLDPFREVIPVMSKDRYLGFIAQDKKTEKYGYIDTRGTVKLEFDYDRLGLIINQKLNERTFNLDEDKIVVAKNDKYGVINLSTGQKILDLKYDDAYLGTSDNYVVKDGKKYYLIDKDGKKILDKGYDMIFAFKNVLIVSEDEKLKIVDYEGNKLVDKEIDLYMTYKMEPIGNVFGYNAKQNINEITISVDKSEVDGYETKEYIYHIDTKTLEEK